MSSSSSTNNPYRDDLSIMYGPENDRQAAINAARPLVLPGGMAPMSGDEPEVAAATTTTTTPAEDGDDNDDDSAEAENPAKKKRKRSARTKKSKADAKAGKQRDELKRQTLLREHRAFASAIMGIGDMRGLTTVPDADDGGVVGVVTRAVEDCNITDQTTITYIEDQVRDFLEKKFKEHFEKK